MRRYSKRKRGVQGRRYAPRIFFWAPAADTKDITAPRLNISVPIDVSFRFAHGFQKAFPQEEARILLWPKNYGDRDRDVALVRAGSMDAGTLAAVKKYVAAFARESGLPCEGLDSPIPMAVYGGFLGFIGEEVK